MDPLWVGRLVFRCVDALTLQPLGAVGGPGRRTTIPVARPPTPGGERPRTARGSSPAASAKQRIQVVPVFAIEIVGREGKAAFSRHARGTTSKPQATVRTSLFFGSCSTHQLNGAMNCKIFRGTDHLLYTSAGVSPNHRWTVDGDPFDLSRPRMRPGRWRRARAARHAPSVMEAPSRPLPLSTAARSFFPRRTCVWRRACPHGGPAAFPRAR